MANPTSLFAHHEPVRFLIAGGINTLFTLGLYWLLLNWLSYPMAYTLSFVSGVLSGYALNTYVVFRRRWSWMKLLAFPSVQVVNYLCGLAVIWVAIHWLRVSQMVAPLLATVVVLPINFLLTRRLIRGRMSHKDGSSIAIDQPWEDDLHTRSAAPGFRRHGDVAGQAEDEPGTSLSDRHSH
jgi:Predicted membrane protein